MISAKTRDVVWHKSGGRCWYCGETLSPATFAVDHLVPRRKGGTDDLENLYPACQSCNSRKGAKNLYDFGVSEWHRVNNVPVFTEEQKRYVYRTLYAQLERVQFDIEFTGFHDFWYMTQGLTNEEPWDHRAWGLTDEEWEDTERRTAELEAEREKAS